MEIAIEEKHKKKDKKGRFVADKITITQASEQSLVPARSLRVRSPEHLRTELKRLLSTMLNNGITTLQEAKVFTQLSNQYINVDGYITSKKSLKKAEKAATRRE